MRQLIYLLCLLPVIVVQAQESHLFRLGAAGQREQYGNFHPFPDGRILISHRSTISGAGSDSILAGLTLLNADLEPQWSRAYKTRVNTLFYDVQLRPDGTIRGAFSSYGTTSRYYSYLVNLSETGELEKTLELVDSSNGTDGYVNKRISLDDGSELLFTSIGQAGQVVIHLGAEGHLLSARKASFEGKLLNFSRVRPVPGTNEWVGIGKITGTNGCFFLRAQDTTITRFHVYTFNDFRLLAPLPDGDFIIAAADEVRVISLLKVDADGEIRWAKSYALPGLSFSEMEVNANGEIWLAGRTSPLVTGVVAHFSPAGEYVRYRHIFKLQQGLQRMTGVLYRSENQLLVSQDYNHSASLNGDLLIHSVHPVDLDFPCFQYPLFNEPSDTIRAYTDSVPTQAVEWETRRWSVTTTLSQPVMVEDRTAVKAAVTCPVGLNAPEEEDIAVLPNPAGNTLWVQGLHPGEPIRLSGLDGRIVYDGAYTGSVDLGRWPRGLYILSIPGKGIHRKFVRE